MINATTQISNKLSIRNLLIVPKFQMVQSIISGLLQVHYRLTTLKLDNFN